MHDLAGGHGLVGWITLLLDPSTTETHLVDTRLPPSAATLHATLSEVWPELGRRVHHHQASLEEVPAAANDRVFGVHACGGLTDKVITHALQAQAHVVLLPCCHSHSKLGDGGLSGWMDRDLAIDSVRAARLREAGYRVWTRTIPEDITPENRLLIARSP